MARYVNIDKFRNELGMNEKCENCERDAIDCRRNKVFTRMDFCGWLDELEIEDVKPVIHARWDGYYGKCSNCGKIPFTDGGSEPFAFGYEYCPYCGAEMEWDI